MTESSPSTAPNDADEAMDSALRAEREALAAIEACERDAAKLIDSAQQRARDILERTDRRIRDVHMRCLQATADRIAAMIEEDSRAAGQDRQEESVDRALGSAVERLAARLTGQLEQ